MDVQTSFWLKSPTEFGNVLLMSSRSLNEILIKSPTELFDLVFAAYNISFISPRVVCLHLYAKGRCTRFQQRALFTVLYSRFKHCAKDVSTFTAQPTILEL